MVTKSGTRATSRHSVAWQMRITQALALNKEHIGSRFMPRMTDRLHILITRSDSHSWTGVVLHAVLSSCAHLWVCDIGRH